MLLVAPGRPSSPGLQISPTIILHGFALHWAFVADPQPALLDTSELVLLLVWKLDWEFDFNHDTRSATVVLPPGLHDVDMSTYPSEFTFDLTQAEVSQLWILCSDLTQSSHAGLMVLLTNLDGNITWRCRDKILQCPSRRAFDIQGCLGIAEKSEPLSAALKLHARISLTG